MPYLLLFLDKSFYVLSMYVCMYVCMYACSVFASAKVSVLDRVYIEMGLILSQETHQHWYFVWKLTLSQSMFIDVVPTLTKNLKTSLTKFVDLIFH